MKTLNEVKAAIEQREPACLKDRAAKRAANAMLENVKAADFEAAAKMGRAALEAVLPYNGEKECPEHLAVIWIWYYACISA